VRNIDPSDRARTARISASSESPTGPARNVIDGVTRSLKSGFGPWADDSTHRWESTALPATIELSWPEAQTLLEIHLTFDSGFERELTLSASEHATRKMIRGAQPEVVREYDLMLDGVVVLSVTDNILRKRIHRLTAPISASRLEIVVKSTHGIPHARIFEVRAYGPESLAS